MAGTSHQVYRRAFFGAAQVPERRRHDPKITAHESRHLDDATGAIAVPEPVRKNVLHLRRAKVALGACDARLTGS
jgi:hypothetical protein